MKAKGRLDCDICGYKATRISLLILHKESEHEGKDMFATFAISKL